MGTFVEIGTTTHSDVAQQAVTAAFEKMAEIDRLMSFHQPDSELSRLNRSGQSGLTVSAHTLEVLWRSMRLMRETGNDFNITVGGGLVRLGELPNHDTEDYIDIGELADIEIRGSHVTLKRPVKITFDGIAKGYAVDLGIAELQSAGIEHGWVNAGGDIRVFGDHDLPVHRRELDGSLTFLGRFANTAVATSSVSQAFDSRFPGRIMDKVLKPRTGIWSVSAPQAWLADALTKVAAATAPGQINARMRDFGGKLLAGLSL